MPTHVLKVEKKEDKWDFSKVFQWAEEYIRGRYYALLITDENEIIIEPRRSTRPLDFGYISIQDRKALEELASELERRYGLTRIEIKSIGWDTERAPWVKVPAE